MHPPFDCQWHCSWVRGTHECSFATITLVHSDRWVHVAGSVKPAPTWSMTLTPGASDEQDQNKSFGHAIRGDVHPQLPSFRCLSSHLNCACSLQPRTPQISLNVWQDICLLPAKQCGPSPGPWSGRSPLTLPPLQATSSAARPTRSFRGGQSSTDMPVTFHKKITSSGYGTTHGKVVLGRPPPKPLKPRRSPVATTAALLRAEPYPMDTPPPTRPQLRVQVFAAPVSAGCAAFSAGGMMLALGSADGKVVAIETSKLAGGCAATQLFLCSLDISLGLILHQIIHRLGHGRGHRCSRRQCWPGVPRSLPGG
jgi:hypothetical protein